MQAPQVQGGQAGLSRASSVHGHGNASHNSNSAGMASHDDGFWETPSRTAPRSVSPSNPGVTGGSGGGGGFGGGAAGGGAQGQSRSGVKTNAAFGGLVLVVCVMPGCGASGPDALIHCFCPFGPRI